MIPSGNLIANDTETTGLSRWRGDLPFIFSFCNAKGQTSAIEFPVDPFTRKVNYKANREGYRELKAFYSNRKIAKVFHNLKFDVGMANAAGFEVCGTLYENTLAAHNCNSAEPSFGLKALAEKYGEYDTNDEEDLHKGTVKLRRKAKARGWNIAEEVQADYWLTQFAFDLLAKEDAEVVRGLALKYAKCDAERTMLLWLMYTEKMKELQTRKHFDFEMEVIEVVRKMENGGAYVSAARIESGLRKCNDIIARNTRIIEKLGGKDFNPGSGPQKIKYFIDKMKFEPLALTAKTRSPQIDNEFLESIEDESPMAQAILEQSRAIKAKSTYLENYKLSMDDLCMLHGNVKMITKTGRFSMTDPNLQNVPKRVPADSAMALVRLPFGPRPGHIWYLGDYAQIEARIFADEADEDMMMQACMGSDVYSDLVKTIKELTGVDIDRQAAKTIFLGKIYGLGKKKLARQLKCGMEEAYRLIREFDDMFPRAKAYMKETIKELYENGYVWTRYGKRLAVDQNYAYRSVNYKIQGNAAGLMKRAMMKCTHYLQELGYGRVVLSIHDELIFEFPLDRRPIKVLRKLRSLMEDNDGVYRVPTPVEFSKVTDTWQQKQPVTW